MVSKYSIDEQTMTNFADGVRWRTGLNQGLTPAQMVAQMKIKYGVNREHTADICPDEGPWVRPDGWPDLDSLNLIMSGGDFIYMTYDANKDASAIAWHIETADKQPATLDIGHIENGGYFVDESHSVTNNTDFIQWTDEYSGYLVLRITGQISRCYSISATRDGQTQHFRQQPILERIAWIPHLTAFCSAYASNAWGLYTLEREKTANGDGTALKSLYYAWAYCRRLHNLDISELYTSNVTDYNSAFYYCQLLKALDLRHWDVQKATSFKGLFSWCCGLLSIDLTGWVTEKVTTFASMFNDCRSLTDIRGLVDFDTSKATNLSSMFNKCYNLADFPVEDWNVENCTNLNGMFAECYVLQELDLSGWDVHKVTNIGSMFYCCQALKNVCFDGWATGILTTAGSLFSNCMCIESVDISWLHITSSCTNIYSMFNNCWSLKELDIPDDWDVSGLGSESNTANSFCSYCYSLERITGISNWQFNQTNSISSMFNCCRSLKEVDVSGWKTDTVTSLSSMFYQCYALERVDVSGWKTDNCTNLAAMFQSCWSLKSIGDISGWNTAKVTTFASMFADCLSLEELPEMGNWNFSAATTVATMFSGVTSIKEITMTNVNLANCTSIASMFRYCRALEKVTLTSWSIPKVTATAPGTFLADCPNLRDVVIDFQIVLNHSYNGDEALSHESLVTILNNLPTVTTKRTLNLMTQNINRLTTEEKQIATNKNWTLAN